MNQTINMRTSIFVAGFLATLAHAIPATPLNSAATTFERREKCPEGVTLEDVRCEARNEAFTNICNTFKAMLEANPDTLVSTTDLKVCHEKTPTNKCCIAWTQPFNSFRYKDLLGPREL